MEDETLNNILNLLQASNNSTLNNSTSSNNNDIQTLLIKFLLSGGLNQIMRNQNTAPTPTPPPPAEKPRTIDLTNYQRLD